MCQRNADSNLFVTLQPHWCPPGAFHPVLLPRDFTLTAYVFFPYTPSPTPPPSNNPPPPHPNSSTLWGGEFNWFWVSAEHQPPGWDVQPFPAESEVTKRVKTEEKTEYLYLPPGQTLNSKTEIRLHSKNKSAFVRVYSPAMLLHFYAEFWKKNLFLALLSTKNVIILSVWYLFLLLQSKIKTFDKCVWC